MEDDLILSESNIEIVHADGTVTDKRDGLRRDYDSHIAHIRTSHIAYYEPVKPMEPEKKRNYFKLAPYVITSLLTMLGVHLFVR